SFRYAAARLRVADTNPASSSTIDIPYPGTFTVDLNVPVDPASVANSNLTLNQGTVTGFTVADDRMSITYTLSGLSLEGPLTVTVADGAYRDAFGNPGAAFSGTYTLHYNFFPLTLTAVNPLGSLVYDPSRAGTIAAAGQTDSFTVPLSAGQTFTLLVKPTGTTLQPAVAVFHPNANLIPTPPPPGPAGHDPEHGRWHLHHRRRRGGRHHRRLHDPGLPGCRVRGGPVRRPARHVAGHGPGPRAFLRATLGHGPRPAARRGAGPDRA